MVPGFEASVVSTKLRTVKTATRTPASVKLSRAIRAAGLTQEAAGKLVKILSEDVPRALLAFRAGIAAGSQGLDQSAFVSTVGDVGEKLGGLIKLAKDNPDVFQAIIAGIATARPVAVAFMDTEIPSASNTL